MAQSSSANPQGSLAIPAEWREGVSKELTNLTTDWSSDKDAFKNVPWGKAMMWIFLVSDTFIFTCFLTGYMTVRMSTTVPWPIPSEVFALTIAGHHYPHRFNCYHDLHFDHQQRHNGDGG